MLSLREVEVQVEAEVFRRIRGILDYEAGRKRREGEELGMSHIREILKVHGEI